MGNRPHRETLRREPVRLTVQAVMLHGPGGATVGAKGGRPFDPHGELRPPVRLGYAHSIADGETASSTAAGSSLLVGFPVGRLLIGRIEYCDVPSGGEERVEAVVDGGAQIQAFGFLEQPEPGERPAEAGEHGFPGMPLAEDVVAGLVGGGGFGEVVGGVTSNSRRTTESRTGR